MASHMILAGDIGGTKSDLAIFEVENGTLRIVHEEKYPSQNYENLESIIQDFLSAYRSTISSACFGIAGPIKDGKCITTNLPWVVDILNITSQIKTSKILLINDLEANAHGIFCLEPHDFFTVHPGASIKGNKALLSAGTGLGEAGVYYDGNCYHPFACEGGHTDFSPRNDLELALLKYLQKETSHVSFERVLSGMGIHNIYNFLLDHHNQPPLEESIKKFKEEKHPEIAITTLALEKKDPICIETLDLFISLYASEAGNLALKLMATGGVYIGGGIAPKILSLMKNSKFSDSFQNKGRMQKVLESIPVKVILNDKAALLGAARVAAIHAGHPM